MPQAAPTSSAVTRARSRSEETTRDTVHTIGTLAERLRVPVLANRASIGVLELTDALVREYPRLEVTFAHSAEYGSACALFERGIKDDTDDFVVVATDAPVTKAQAERLAMAAHDGLARAVRTSHLPMDGDSFFALSTGGGGETGVGVPGEELALFATVAADCAERAVVHAVLAAASMYEVPSWTELME